MKTNEFNKIVEARLNLCRETLIVKAKQYAKGSDRLANFKKAATMQNIAPIEALRGMMAKHNVCFYDQLDLAVEKGKVDPRIINEVITDMINYLILTEALLIDEKCLEGSEDKEE